MPNLIPWKARFFRITLFSVEPVSLKGIDWQEEWKKIEETEPEFRSIPQEQKIVLSAEINGGYQLINDISSTRIDWILKRKEDIDFESMEMNDIGNWDDIKVLISNLSQKVFSNISFEVKRIAFGIVLQYPVANVEEGLSKILPLLPVTINSTEGRDFLFQFNAPKEYSDGPIIEINRLSKWAVINLGIQKASEGIVEDLPDKQYCQVELDINTDKDNIDSLNEKLESIFKFILSEAKNVQDVGVSGILS